MIGTTEPAGPSCVVEVDLPAGTSSPRLARRALTGSLERLLPVRRADLLLLASEVVTSCVDAGRPADTIRVRLERVPNGMAVEIRDPACTASPDTLTRALLGRLADDWTWSGGVVRFLVKTGRAGRRTPLPEADLFRLAAGGDHDARELLFEKYQNFARSLVRRFGGTPDTRSDLTQVAAVGLIKAIDRFDPTIDIKFTTYAARTIEGELKRYLRDSSWSVRVPRRLQELSLRAALMERELEQRLGRAPTVEELAGALQVGPRTVAEALVARDAYRAMSIEGDGTDESPDPSVEQRLAEADPHLEHSAERADLLAAIERLPERERRILYLRFFEDRSQAEIAEMVGVSQMHVSRLIRRSLEQLGE